PRLPRAPLARRPGPLGHLARRPAGRDGRARRPPLVRSLSVPSGVPLDAVPSASALRRLRGGGGRAARLGARIAHPRLGGAAWTLALFALGAAALLAAHGARGH